MRQMTLWSFSYEVWTSHAAEPLVTSTWTSIIILSSIRATSGRAHSATMSSRTHAYQPTPVSSPFLFGAAIRTTVAYWTRTFPISTWRIYRVEQSKQNLKQSLSDWRPGPGVGRREANQCDTRRELLGIVPRRITTCTLGYHFSQLAV
jgi:hypothetical protein